MIQILLKLFMFASTVRNILKNITKPKCSQQVSGKQQKERPTKKKLDTT